jgi:uncharacterized membrane protein YdbT with pleckstrin-like domain
MDNYQNYSNDQYIWDSKAFPQKSNPEEDIVLLVRQDIVIIILRFLGAFVILFFLFIIKIGLLLSNIITTAPIVDSVFNWVITVVVLGYFLNFITFFHNYYLSLQLVTTDRIIDIDQTGLFHREVNELSIDNIQDVTYKQNGIFQSFLGYGNVIVQTAGSEKVSHEGQATGGFVFENCSQPAKVAGIINDLFHKYKETQTNIEAQKHAHELKKAFDSQSLINQDYSF